MEGHQELSIEPAKNILEKYKDTHNKIEPEYLIPILQGLQNAYGYLPVSILSWLSKQTKIPTSRMYGVITFYSQFYLKPHGKHTIRCCRGTACHVKGGKQITEVIKEKLEVSHDMSFTYEEVACLGTCFLAPVVMIDNDYYGKLSSSIILSILEKYRHNRDNEKNSNKK